MEPQLHLLIKFPDGTEAPMVLTTGHQLQFPVVQMDDNNKAVDAMLEIHLVAITQGGNN